MTHGSRHFYLRAILILALLASTAHAVDLGNAVRQAVRHDQTDDTNPDRILDIPEKDLELLANAQGQEVLNNSSRTNHPLHNVVGYLDEVWRRCRKSEATTADASECFRKTVLARYPGVSDDVQHFLANYILSRQAGLSNTLGKLNSPNLESHAQTAAAAVAGINRDRYVAAAEKGRQASDEFHGTLGKVKNRNDKANDEQTLIRMAVLLPDDDRRRQIAENLRAVVKLDPDTLAADYLATALVYQKNELPTEVPAEVRAAADARERKRVQAITELVQAASTVVVLGPNGEPVDLTPDALAGRERFREVARRYHLSDRDIFTLAQVYSRRPLPTNSPYGNPFGKNVPDLGSVFLAAMADKGPGGEFRLPITTPRPGGTTPISNPKSTDLAALTSSVMDRLPKQDPTSYTGGQGVDIDFRPNTGGNVAVNSGNNNGGNASSSSNTGGSAPVNPPGANPPTGAVATAPTVPVNVPAVVSNGGIGLNGQVGLLNDHPGSEVALGPSGMPLTVSRAKVREGARGGLTRQFGRSRLKEGGPILPPSNPNGRPIDVNGSAVPPGVTTSPISVAGAPNGANLPPAPGGGGGGKILPEVAPLTSLSGPEYFARIRQITEPIRAAFEARSRLSNPNDGLRVRLDPSDPRNVVVAQRLDSLRDLTAFDDDKAKKVTDSYPIADGEVTRVALLDRLNKEYQVTTTTIKFHPPTKNVKVVKKLDAGLVETEKMCAIDPATKACTRVQSEIVRELTLDGELKTAKIVTDTLTADGGHIASEEVQRWNHGHLVSSDIETKTFDRKGTVVASHSGHNSPTSITPIASPGNALAAGKKAAPATRELASDAGAVAVQPVASQPFTSPFSPGLAGGNQPL